MNNQQSKIVVQIDPILLSNYQCASEALDQANAPERVKLCQSLFHQIQTWLDFSALIEDYEQKDYNCETTHIRSFTGDVNQRTEGIINGITSAFLSDLAKIGSNHPLQQDAINTIQKLYRTHCKFLIDLTLQCTCKRESCHNGTYIHQEYGQSILVSTETKGLLDDMDKYLNACYRNLAAVEEQYALAQNKLLAHIQSKIAEAYEHQKTLSEPEIIFMTYHHEIYGQISDARYGWPLVFDGVDIDPSEDSADFITINDQLNDVEQTLKATYICQQNLPYRKDICQALQKMMAQKGKDQNIQKIANCFNIDIKSLQID